MERSVEKYLSKGGLKYKPESQHFGWTTIECLNFLKGNEWNEVALAYVHALNPSIIRVTHGEVFLNAHERRVTVYINNENRIQKIEQEVQVWLPDGIECGEALNVALLYGRESEQCKWYQDVEMFIHDGINHRYYKRTKDGKIVDFPE